MNWDRILLYEMSPEAYEAVQSGDAVVGTGGIRRKGAKGKGFLELAKPAVISVADFQSLFEGKEHAIETDERLNQLESQNLLSEAAIKEIENTAWLNNTAIQRTYSLTQEGFRQTLQGLEKITEQQSSFEKYVYRRDFRQLYQEMLKYINYLKTDEGNLRSKKYNVTNGHIAEHLDQMSAMIKTLMKTINNDEEDSFLAVMIIKNLLPPFAYVVRKYSALYYYENDCELMPGAYDEWVHTISMVCKSRKFKEKLTYYINLNSSMPFKDKMLFSRDTYNKISVQILNVEFDRHYICDHSKEEYLSIGEQVYRKIVSKDYYFQDNTMVINLQNAREQDGEIK